MIWPTRRRRNLIDRLVAEQEIRTLPVRYALAVDDRDIELLMSLFTPDCVLRTGSGAVKGRSWSEVRTYFEDEFDRLGPSFHIPHAQVIEVTARDEAEGTVLAHTEVWRDGVQMLSALRYYDSYRRIDGAWKFAERVQSFQYRVEAAEYPSALGHRLRVRAAGGQLQPADWPLNGEVGVG